MAQRRGPDGARPDGGVRDLEGHPDGEGQVGEVEVPRVIVLVETDTPITPVVEPGVAQSKERVDEEPGQRHARRRHPGQQPPARAVGRVGGDQHHRHRDQTGQAGGEEQDVADRLTGVFPIGVGRGGGRVHAADADPRPGGERRGQGVPAHQPAYVQSPRTPARTATTIPMIRTVTSRSRAEAEPQRIVTQRCALDPLAMAPVKHLHLVRTGERRCRCQIGLPWRPACGRNSHR